MQVANGILFGASSRFLRLDRFRILALLGDGQISESGLIVQSDDARRLRFEIANFCTLTNICRSSAFRM